MPCIIRDSEGKAINTSRNLRGIRRYVGQNLIKVLSIDAIAKGEGKLMILFDNKASFETNFASFNVLRDQVRQWRNVYGAPLRVNGVDCGKVSKDNAALKPDEEIKARLEYLRGELNAEKISYDGLHELQNYGELGLIPPGDVQLLEAAGVPEQLD